MGGSNLSFTARRVFRYAGHGGRRILGLAAIAAAFLVALSAGRGHSAQEIQVPAPRGYVNDFAGVLGGSTVQHLEALNRELAAKTGAEITIVTVRTAEPVGAFDYAMRVAEAWKPGAKGKDNGVVFLVATDDHDMFIATGYGIEGALPDGLVGEIRDRLILPRFREGNYAGGIRSGTEALAAAIAREHGVTLSATSGAAPSPRQRSRRSPLWRLVLLIVFLVLFGRAGLWPFLFLGRGTRRGTFGGGFGGGGFGGGGGGFGGFGGGSFGGGGAGGRW